MTRHAIDYRPEIDGVRAVAVAGVILAHAGAPLAGGFLGVDVFFVLSGFLITRILIKELDEGKFSLLAFYERRVRRILPALFVVVAASIPFAFRLMPPDQMQAFERSIVALMVFATNVKFWMEAGYFAPSAEVVPLLHTWSLAVEEQFYVLFPPLLWALWRWGGRRAGLVMGGAAILSLGAAEWAARAAPSAAFFLLPFRAWELLAGALAGLAMARGLPDRVPDQAAGALAAAGLLAVLVSFRAVDEHAPIPGVVVLPAIAGTAAILLFARPGAWTHRALSLRPLVWLGLISYSAYLWHQPLFAFARLSRIGAPSDATMAAMTGLTIALAWATWAWVEEPFRRRAVLPSRVALPVLGTAAAVLMAVGVAGHLGQGIGSLRFTEAELAVLRSGDLESEFKVECPEEALSEACVRTVGVPRFAVVGDSHSQAIAVALAEMLPAGSGGVVGYTRNTCPPAVGIDITFKDCSDDLDRITARILNEDAIEIVILAWRPSYYPQGDHETVYPQQPDSASLIQGDASDDEKRAVYWEGIRATIDALRAGAKRVIVLDPVPELGARPQAIMVSSGEYGVTAPGADLDWFEQRHEESLRKFDALDVERIPVRPILCPKDRCRVFDGEHLLYRDDDHLSLAGALRVVDAYLPTLLDDPSLGDRADAVGGGEQSDEGSGAR